MSHETPKRWSELPPGDGPAARAGALARAAGAAPPPLTQETLAAIQGRVAAAPLRPRPWVKPAGLASVAIAAVIGWLLLRPGGELPPRPALRVPEPPAKVAPLPEPEAIVPEETLAPEPEPEPKRAPQVRAPPPPRVVATAPPPSEESSLLVETRMLRVALEELRQKRDAAAAHRSLDAYFARFPHGALEREALVARVDVFQALGRRDEALATLNQLQQAGFAGVPRGLELRVLRAELFSAKDQCADAMKAFEQCFAEALPPSLEERALVGRASCRGRLGDADGSRADLERYLGRFPEGRFAAQARAALGQ